MATSKVSATTFLMALCLLQTPLVRSQATRKGELSARQIAQKTFPSVVVLIAEDRSGSYLGSGFFVDSDVVATNYHVIKGAAKITARRVDQKHVYHCSVVTFDDDKDLALLRVEGAIGHPLPLAKNNRDAVGDVVYVAGNPEGFEGTFSQGIISALRGSEYFQITAPISHGSSGGPVLNNHGEVIGVAVGTIAEGQNLNFAIPISRLLALIARWMILRSSPASAMPRDRSVNGKADPASAFVDDGSRLLSEQRYDEAATAFKNALRLNADDTRALLGLARVYEGLHKYQEAIDVYNDLIRTHPQEEDSYESLAMVLFSLERYNEALDIYRRAIKSNPKWISAYLGAAAVLEFQWKIEASAATDLLGEAESILIAATRDSADPPAAYEHLGDLYCDYLKKCIEAIAQYRKAIQQVDQTNPITAPLELGALHHKMGTAYLTVGDRSSAIKEYKILKSIDRGRADQLFNEIYK